MKALDIAIAGAGPAGLATALMLSAAGHRVTVFERFEEPAPVGSGLILQPTGLTVMHDLGLYGAIAALGARIDRLYGSDAESGRTVLDVRYDALDGRRFGLAVHRAALFGVLYEAARRAAGLAIVTGVEIDGAEAGAERIALTGPNGRKLGSFDLVVDATGARSRLRRLVDTPAEPRPLAYGAFWVSLDWRGEGFDEHALVQRYSRANVMIGVLPIGRPDARSPRMAAFFWSLKPAEAEQVRAAGLEAWKARVAGLWPECRPYLDQVESFEQLTLARYGHHTLKRPAARRLAVIGDAAHSTSPQLGQGANMALLDARALAHALAISPTIEDALETYVRARRRHVRVFQALSWAFTPFYQSDSRLLPFVRDRLVPTLAKILPAPQLLAAMVAGTIVDPFAPVGLREAAWHGLQPGNTLPAEGS